MKVINANDNTFSLEDYVKEQKAKISNKESIAFFSVLAISIFITYFLHEVAGNFLYSIFNILPIWMISLMSAILIFSCSCIIIKKSLDKHLLELSKNDLSTYVAIEYIDRVELKGVIPAKVLRFALDEFEALKDDDRYELLEYKDAELYNAFSVLKKIDNPNV